MKRNATIMIFSSLMLLVSINTFSQKLAKIKFKDRNGNIIYYTGYENSDVIQYCNLYYLPAGATKARSITILNKRIEEDDSLGGLTRYCIPVRISLNGNSYKCEVGIGHDYFNIIDNNGTRTRFSPIYD